jgi:uncharacterized lipoprotein YajG
MKNSLIALAAALLLAGCGFAETTAVATSEAASAAEQLKQGKELEEKVQRDIEAAQQAAADARDKAEAETQ